MKKSLSLLLALIFVLSLASCAGGNAASPAPSTAVSAAPSAAASEAPAPSGDPSGLPITAEKSDLDVWCNWGYAGNATILKDWNDSVGYQVIEEKTNVHINWTIPTNGSESEAFNILIASNDYPDIIMNFTMYYTSGLQHAVDNSIILPLDDVIDKYMPNYMSRVNGNEDRQKRVKTDSGIHAAIFMINNMKQAPWGGQVIRKDWLDELCLAIPETYDELHTVLTAFKDQKGAEKPMKIGNSGDNFNYAFAGGFGAANTMMQKDGKVYFGPMLPEFKEYLTLASAWFAEGLIDKEFMSANPFDDADWFNNKTGYQFGFANVGTAEEVGGRSPDAGYLTIGVANPVVNKGDVGKFGIASDDVSSGSVITTQSEKVEICARWMDYLYSDEGSVAINFGKEGETFFFDEEGNPTVDAAAVEKKYSQPFSSLQMVLGPVNGPFYSIKYEGYGLKKASAGMMMTYMEAGKTWLQNDGSALIPTSVTMTADEATEYYSKINDINTFVNEAIVKIITGAEPVDSFDNVAQTLKEMGIDRCVAIQQGALERFNNR